MSMSVVLCCIATVLCEECALTFRFVLRDDSRCSASHKEECQVTKTTSGSQHSKPDDSLDTSQHSSMHASCHTAFTCPSGRSDKTKSVFFSSSCVRLPFSPFSSRPSSQNSLCSPCCFLTASTTLVSFPETALLTQPMSLCQSWYTWAPSEECRSPLVFLARSNLTLMRPPWHHLFLFFCGSDTIAIRAKTGELEKEPGESKKKEQQGCGRRPTRPEIQGVAFRLGALGFSKGSCRVKHRGPTL